MISLATWQLVAHAVQLDVNIQQNLPIEVQGLQDSNHIMQL
jgi:hypothetical protein